MVLAMAFEMHSLDSGLASRLSPFWRNCRLRRFAPFVRECMIASSTPRRAGCQSSDGGALRNSNEVRTSQASISSCTSGPIRAAEYVRMSTEHQQYSTENQHAAIQRYAD